MNKRVHSQVRINKDKGFDEGLNSYADIKKWRKQHMIEVSTDHQQLNQFHDQLIQETVSLAMVNVQSEWGEPPASFAFFLMGSAGRFEQSVWSDQDHGIIYDGNENCQSYFLKLGSEIRDGLNKVGYELCDGQVMSSNPLWCKSINSWKQQVTDWLHEDSWESLRHFSTFFDSRVLIGESNFLDLVKQQAFAVLQKYPRLYTRLAENVGFVKKGVGVVGQLLPEVYGEQTGMIKLKQTAFFPYVNAMRLLALKNQMLVPSTLSRFRALPVRYSTIKIYESFFIQLLDFRIKFCRDAESYKEVHLVAIDSLTKEDKQQLKQLMKKGYKLFSETKTIMEKECSTWL